MTFRQKIQSKGSENENVSIKLSRSKEMCFFSELLTFTQQAGEVVQELAVLIRRDADRLKSATKAVTKLAPR